VRDAVLLRQIGGAGIAMNRTIADDREHICARAAECGVGAGCRLRGSGPETTGRLSCHQYSIKTEIETIEGQENVAGAKKRPDRGPGRVERVTRKVT
jgi:hypothetical protein